MDVDRLVQRSQAPAFATDSDNRVVAANGAALELLGRDPTEIAGSGLGDVLRGWDVYGNRLCAGACALHEMVLTGEAVQGFEIDLLAARGKRRRVRVSVTVVLGPESERYHLVWALAPRRRRRRADEAIDRLLRGQAVAVPPVTNGGPAPSSPPEAAGGNGGNDGTGEAPLLTSRQREVLRHIAEGEVTADIAKRLCISAHTVRNHTQNILHRLSAHSRAEAAAIALRQGLI